MVTKSWKLGVDKNGGLIVTYLDGRGIMKTAIPASGSVSVRGRGMAFAEGRNPPVECLCQDPVLQGRMPLPVAKMRELGTFDDAAVRRLRSHILGFVYEFVAGVCFDRNPVIVRKPPFDLDALLAEYPRYASELNLTDWASIMDII